MYLGNHSMSARDRICLTARCTLTILLIAGAQTAWAENLTRGEAARELGEALGIPLKGNETNLYGLFPGIFPGGYDGTFDVSYHDHPATLETIVVSLVRWTGWDTVHYDTRLVSVVKPYVTPEGFPFYAPDPTPRSIPYVIVALNKGLISRADLPKLRSPVSAVQIRHYADAAKAIRSSAKIRSPLLLDAAGEKYIEEARQNSAQLIVLPSGFRNYALLKGLSNRILDLNAPSLRIFNSASSLSGGKQDYFPLGPLETQLSVGLHVPEDSYAHQSEAIYGIVENASTTVNAVGLWGSASSLKENARVWGGFFKSATAKGPDNDAQVVGLEVDVINQSLPGITPNRSKTGIQVVGIGSSTVTNAVEVIGAGPAKWTNGILFADGSIANNGAVIGLAQKKDVARGIDFSAARFTGPAIALSQGSTVSMGAKAGRPSSIYTDAIGNGHLVITAGLDGLRIPSNDDTKNLLVVQPDGDLVTPMTSLGQLKSELGKLEAVRASGRNSPPAKSTDPCTIGSWASDDDYFYVCTATNVWRRARLSSW